MESKSFSSPPIVGRRRFLKGGLAAGAGIIGATMYSSPFAQVSEDGNLVVISGADISTFDPYKTNAFKDLAVISAVAQRLTRMSKTKFGEIEGILALNWEPVKPDTWRISLREGVKFHNGADFNAETAKWCVETFAVDALGKSMTTSFDHVDIVDAHTIELVTKFPHALVPLVLNASCDMLDPVWKQSGDYSEETLIGTGPARVAEWVKGQYVVLERNPDYWGQAVEFDRYVIRAVTEAATRDAARKATSSAISQDAQRAATRRHHQTVEQSLKVICAVPRGYRTVQRQRAPMNYRRHRLIVTQVLKGSASRAGPRGRRPATQESVKAYPYDRMARCSPKPHPGFSMETARGRRATSPRPSPVCCATLGNNCWCSNRASIRPSSPDRNFYWSSGNIIQTSK